MNTIDEPSSQPKWRRYVTFLAGFFGLFAGLCTVFALVVTTALAWSEHAQAHWPAAAAHVQRCGVDFYNHTLTREAYWIDCKLSYTVGAEDVVSHVHSRSTPASQRITYEFPAGQFERMQEWVNEHPAGTPIAVHYDPSNHAKAVLVETDMPRGGPQTPDNLKLLGFCALSCAVLLTIARIARPTAEFPGTNNDRAFS
jgi:hypothetical protein